MRNQIDLEISQQLDVGDVRRQAVAMARRAISNETALGHVALVATELGRNIIAHAGGHGRILLRLNLDQDPATLDLLARDLGPGIGDIARALEDGYSTGGTPGTGLGAVRRLSQQFDLYSRPGGGTVAFSRIGLGAGTTEPSCRPVPTLDGLRLPAAGETVCGDHFAIRHQHGLTSALLVDALGHGPQAAEVANLVVELFQQLPVDLPPDACCHRLHQGLRSTRGAALAVVQIDAKGRLLFSGIGNITGRLVTADSSRQILSQPGIAGHARPTANCEQLPFESGSRLYLHSDGVVSRWSLDPYPGLGEHHPLVQSAVLLRDFHRRGDDASMLILHGVPHEC